MTKRTTFAVLFVATPLALLMQGCPDQPSIECVSAHGMFVTKFTPTSGSGSCAEIPGDVVGIQQYSPKSSNPEKPDLDQSFVAIGTTSMGSLMQYARDGIGGNVDEVHKAYAIGKFSTKEPANDLCTVPTLDPAQQVLDAVPIACEESDSGIECGAEGGPPVIQEPQPAVDLKYTWSDVRFLVKASAPGTVFKAKLAIEDSGCTAGYDVVGLYPAIPCGEAPIPGIPIPGDTVDTCAPACDPAAGEKCSATGTCIPDGTCADDADCGIGVCATAGPYAGSCAGPCPCPEGATCQDDICVVGADVPCRTDPRPDLGIPYGSGINTDFKVACDADLGMCMLTELPAGI
jgi:hypothetical protein